MFVIELIATAIGLSMDAFSVSICKGLSMKRLNFIQAAIIAFVFGAFQAVMPLIGFIFVILFKDTETFANVITANAPIIAFVLLVFLGTKMIRDALKGKSQEDLKRAKGDDPQDSNKLSIPELLALGVATSIDALMIGFAFAIVDVNMIFAVTIIGLTTFLFSFVGVFIAHFFSAKWEKPATIVGGIILILIGMRFGIQFIGLI